MSSGWFDCTEPSLSTSLQGKQGVHGAYALVRGGSSTYRTFSNDIIREIPRCVEFCHMSSGWFESLQGQQGMKGVVYLLGVVQACRTSSNLLEPHHNRDSKVCRVFSQETHRTSSNLLEPHHYRDSKVCRVLSHEFGVVRQYRTFSIYIVTGVQGAYALVRGGSSTSNLVQPHHFRDSKVCRVLSHEFGVVRLYRTFSIYIVTKIARWVVRLYRTFSIYIVTEIARCAGCLCTCSGWFKHIEPPRTFSNHIITKIARCVEFCHMSSGWFDCTEPSLSTSLQGKQSMQGSCTSSGCIEPRRTFSNHIITEIVRCVEFCHMSQPYQTFSIYIVIGETRYAGCYALVRGGSSTSNLIELSLTTEPPRTSRWSGALVHEGVSRPTGKVRVSSGCTECLCTSSD